MTSPYSVGQQVMMRGGEICTVVEPEDGKPAHFGVWVFVPSRGYASDYALHNVSPLPATTNSEKEKT